MPTLALAVSGMFVLLMSGLILYQTQEIIRDGERNYIMVTVTRPLLFHFSPAPPVTADACPNAESD